MQNKVQNKVFLFDRDSTLIDRSKDLFNKDIIKSFFIAIKNRKLSWGIISSGAIYLAHDDAYKKLKDFSSQPAYSMLGKGNGTFLPLKNDWGFTVNGLPEKDSEQYIHALLVNGKFDKEGSFSATVGKEKFTIENIAETQFFEITHDNLVKDGKNEFKNPFKKPIILKINLKKWLNNRELFANGDNKLFKAIFVLEQLGYRLDVSEIPDTFGIETSGGDNLKPIRPSDVVFLDDKKGVCDLMQQACFHSLRADTTEATAKDKELETTNTYLLKLGEQIGFVNILNYLKDDLNNNPPNKKELINTWKKVKELMVHEIQEKPDRFNDFSAALKIHRDGERGSIWCRMFQKSQPTSWRKAKQLYDNSKDTNENTPLLN